MKTLLILLVLACALPATAQDATDPSSVIINGGADVRSWAVTTTITALSTSQQGIEAMFSKRQGSDWPDVIPSGWAGPVYYTVWLGTRLSNGVHLAASLNVYRGQAGSGAGDVTNIGQYSQNLWYLDGELKSHVVTEGETLYLMVTAGGMRGTSAVTVQERSNIVAFQASSQPRTFMFSAPPPVVTPPVIVPSPVVVPPVVTPPVVTPPLDLSSVNTQLAAILREVEAGRAENQQFFEEARSKWRDLFVFLGKYGTPVIAGILGTIAVKK
jgi:hypothetical protein